MFRALLLASALGAGWSGYARAAFILDFEQVGADVIATGSGTLNTSDLGNPIGVYTSLVIYPEFSDVAVGRPTGSFIGGGPAATARSYSAPISGVPFGTGNVTFETTGSGDIVGISQYPYDQSIVVPAGYVSGSSLSTSATFASNTLAGLGLKPGTFVFTFGSGEDVDAFTVQVGPGTTSLPEPTTIAILGLGVVSLVAARKRR